MTIHILVLIVLVGIIPLLLRRKLSSAMVMRSVTGGLLVLNGVVAIAALSTATVLWFNQPQPVQASPVFQEETAAQQEGTQEGEGGMSGNTAMAAALAVGLAAIGSGFAVGLGSSAAMGAITESPENFGRILIFVGLGEGIAIYGLIISFLILTGGLGG